ncbi:MAG: DNA-processing protein DprA [Anaerolineales bacterium]|nr:DNA-processing protein DprA [Anaerolineales bacterium]MCB9127741.1 DNA-protecting protein DprA [Ardenticatenales bacterium]
MDDLKYWIGFNRVSGIGPIRFQRLFSHFGGDLRGAWHAPADELAALGLEQRALNNLLQQRQQLDLDAEMAALAAHGVTAVTLNDEAYPRLLRDIPSAPFVLYMRGEWLAQDEWAVAIVGTRRVSNYGRRVTEMVAHELADAGLTIVSGLALGIDRIAHEAAMAAGGRTIAVLANGVETAFPVRNRRLGERIVDEKRGLLISDYPLGTAPEAANFPPRNRIISGLALATLVVEAGEKSGALITARNAVEQGRDVFAVPGNISNASSKGTNRLIQQGAIPLLSAQDLLDALDIQMAEPKQAVRELVKTSATESLVLGMLSGEPRHIDEVGRDCGLPTATVSSTLSLLELKGLVSQSGSMMYVRL